MNKYLYKNKCVKKKLLKCMKVILGLTISIAITNGSIVYASEAINSGAEKANEIGFQVWKVVKIISKWIMAGYVVKDVLQSFNEGDVRSLFKILMKYGFAYAVIVSIIKFFDWIEKLAM